jgi:hypothetical protein
MDVIMIIDFELLKMITFVMLNEFFFCQIIILAFNFLYHQL